MGKRVHTFCGSLERLGLHTLSIELDGAPSEFRVFRAGENETTKGTFLFDEQAANAVMAAAADHDVDVMIDLEHLSLDEESKAFDPDARGWCRLALRDGELWAVDVTWTLDGQTRLAEKRQRYVSPAFLVDDDGRVIEVVNIALTAMPATHGALALVAAARRRDQGMKPAQLAKLLELRRAGKSDGEILTELAIDIKSLQAVVKAMGGDPSADLGQLMAMVAAYAKELSDMASGNVSAESEAGAGAEEEMPAVEQMRRERDALRAQRDAALKAERAEVEQLRKQLADREDRDRVELTAALVVAGALTPAMAWQEGHEGTRPSAMIAKLSVDDLRGWLRVAGGVRAGAAPAPPKGTVMGSGGGVEISEYEAKRVELAARRSGVDEAIALERYQSVKQRQADTAERRGAGAHFGRRLEQSDVIATVTGRIGPEEIRKLTNAVRPHETFSPTAQRALEEFRLDLMVNLASEPDDWSVRFGAVVPGGTTKDTFPLDFSAVEFRERLGQNAAAETPQTRDISLTKREFRAAKMGDLRRIQQGDFAYIRSWQQGAAQMARAKMRLRSSLVKALLEAGESTYWGYSAEQTTGVEGVYYFATTHKVHPFNSRMTIKASGATTWSNLQGSAKPLGVSNLFAELDSMLVVPHFDGELLGTEGDALILPTSLVGTARRMFDQQPFRSDGETSSVQLGNEFYGYPMERVHASNLEGSDTTANYYVVAKGTIALGFAPWVIAEDSEDEVLVWDENSDFYRDTGNIKIEEKTYINAALAWPHAIRKVSGS